MLVAVLQNHPHRPLADLRCKPRWSSHGSNPPKKWSLRKSRGDSYFPKGTDLSRYSQADLNRVALQLNQRPRKTLGVRSPAEVFNDSVALTG